MDVLIVGAGIGGLTLALELDDAGIPCRLVDAAPDISPIGAGINVLPHASRILSRLGLEERLAEVGVTTEESVFFNRFGQLIYREPAGRFAGYDHPQLSLHRGDLQGVLLDAVRERLGADAVVMGRQAVSVHEDGGHDNRGTVRLRTRDVVRGRAGPDETASVVVACDGIHSAIRRQLHPDEGEPVYSGVNMWRGVAAWEPFLTGASMVRAGWLAHGKMVIYPVREQIDEQGRQLVNWVAELETPRRTRRDWTRHGSLADFIEPFEDWRFDWLDVPALIRASDSVLEYPMVDQEPLSRWTFGRVTLLGDAAHPMVPRGSNGAGQAILDARALRLALETYADPEQALLAYEGERLPATAEVVRTNRRQPPDAILREVYERTGDRPFARIEDVISEEEMAAISESYRRVSGNTRERSRLLG
jgi:5-methylphenazine-1-carboxylate 1-monooxygenase